MTLSNLHNLIAYFVFISMFIFFIIVVIYRIKRKNIDLNLIKLSKVNLIIFHSQFLLGLINFYYTHTKINNIFGSNINIFLYLFHPIVMTTSVILVTIVNSKIKKIEYINNNILIFLILSYLFIFLATPYFLL